MWNIDKAVAHLDKSAHKDLHGTDKSVGRCAEYVRKAIEAGGVHLIRHQSAKDYGSSLEKVGMKPLPGTPHNSFLAGDVAVIQPIAGHPHGHMAMFNGKIWISDFRQWHGFYPGPSYRKLKPPYKIYRISLIVAAPPPIQFSIEHTKVA